MHACNVTAVYACARHFKMAQTRTVCLSIDFARLMWYSVQAEKKITVCSCATVCYRCTIESVDWFQLVLPTVVDFDLL